MLLDLLESILRRHSDQSDESDENGHLMAQRLKELLDVREPQAGAVPTEHTDGVRTSQAEEELAAVTK